MELKKPKNSNYAAIVVQIQALVPLENCNNVQAAIILGNQVIVGKDVKISDIGIYFPLECQLSKEYLSSNNLYRKAELNNDPNKKGYFEENGRIRCVKFRGHKSEGLFMPIQSILFTLPKVKEYNAANLPELPVNLGDEFDEINGVEICRKYVVKNIRTPRPPGSKKVRSTKKYESKLVDNQFKFHQDTSMLYRNLHKINPDDLIGISYKIHGSSGISSYILCKKVLKWWERLLKFIGINIVDQNYDYIYSSRKVIKNERLNPNAQHYYKEDIWGIAHKELEPFLTKGLTLYYEIAGYLPSGGMIQKDYDYNCGINQHRIYIYRVTYTNVDGKVFEFSAKQVQDWCKQNGLNAVPELYYGYSKNFFPYLGSQDNLESWRNDFLEVIKKQYNEKDCFICSNKVPEEGCVIRVEGLDFEAFKAKSNRFYERETKLLDKGESNIEDEN